MIDDFKEKKVVELERRINALEEKVNIDVNEKVEPIKPVEPSKIPATIWDFRIFKFKKYY